MTLLVLLRSPRTLASWLMVVARSPCVLVRSVLTPPTSVFTLETSLATAVTCCAVCFWAVSSRLASACSRRMIVLGARIHLLLRQAQ